MPCVMPLMVGTRRRHPSCCWPGLEEPAQSWDEQHLPFWDPLGWGNAMPWWSQASGTLLSTSFAHMGRQQSGSLGHAAVPHIEFTGAL